MTQPKVTEVFRTYQQAESVLMAAALRQHGLHPTVFGDHMAAMAGIGIYVDPIRIMVPRAEVLEARAVVAIIETVAKEEISDDISACPACEAQWEPGFDVCWQCDAQRPTAPVG